MDAADINWKLFIQLFVYGMNKYILKEESELPITGKRNFVRVSDTPKTLFSDLTYVFRHGKDQNTLDHKVITREVLESAQVKKAIRGLVEEELVSSSLSEAKLLKIQHDKGVVAETVIVGNDSRV